MTTGLVSHLLDQLNSAGIRYCHWKSNFYLERALAGEIDLDLLVDHKAMPELLDIVLENGFIPATAIKGPQSPGISHYYGMDPLSGELVHLHIFTSVLTGESFIKSHLLPFDEMLLENWNARGNIRVAAKRAELVIFTLRTYIKYGSWLDFIILRKEHEQLREELLWLQSGNDLSEALKLLEIFCPVVEPELFKESVDAIRENRSLVSRVRLAWKVRRRLRVYCLYAGIQRYWLYTQVIWDKLWRQLRGHKKNKRLLSGGAVLAFVGPEATGKSTLVSESERWLKGFFATSKVHVGKPPSSWLTLPLNLTLPILRSNFSRFRTSRLEGHAPTENGSSISKDSGFSDLVYALRAVTLAWDRRNLLLRVRRSVSNGELVICDRYPSEEIGAMDSRRLQPKSTSIGRLTAVYNWLANLEERLYDQIPPPDTVLRLSVSLETAKQRNRERIKPGKESDDYLESRHRQAGSWYRPGTKYIFDIDTEKPLGETFLSIKQAIWKSL